MAFSLQQPGSVSPDPARNALSVTQLMDRIGNAVRVSVGTQWVEGEISNLSIPSSGHIYFTLKDAGAQISCVFFRFRATSCRVQFRDGLKVRVFGEASVYEKRGQMQLNLTKVEESGIGELQMRFMELKQKLEAEGLFAPELKKPIPAFPKAVGLVTSATGAALQDMRHIFEERAPWVRVYLIPVPVQGEGAEVHIASAIRAWGNAPSNGLPAIDTLIVARGGGSIEDLWNFNEEIVARAIVACPLPVISGVGHEIDFTIADFASDLRAPTPTAAAVLATPDGPALLQKLETARRSLMARVSHTLSRARLNLEFYERSRLTHPSDLIAPFAQELDSLEYELGESVGNRLTRQSHLLDALEVKIKSRHPKILNEHRKEQLDVLRQKLETAVRNKLQALKATIDLQESRIRATSPEKTLRRGYALVRTESGNLVRNPDAVSCGELLHITVDQGALDARKV